MDGEVVNLLESGSAAIGSGLLTSSANAGAKKNGPIAMLGCATDDVIKAKSTYARNDEFHHWDAT